jgi:hypothetical protein
MNNKRLNHFRCERWISPPPPLSLASRLLEGRERVFASEREDWFIHLFEVASEKG